MHHLICTGRPLRDKKVDVVLWHRADKKHSMFHPKDPMMHTLHDGDDHGYEILASIDLGMAPLEPLESNSIRYSKIKEIKKISMNNA